jgi:beta-phosphoglucomutase
MTELRGHAVIFDMDGVLVDSGEAHFQAFSRVGELRGFPFPRELFVRTHGMHTRRILALWLGGGVSDEEAARIGEEKEVLYRELARGCLRAIPGALELARRLRAAGARTAVGSSAPRPNVELALELLQARKLFDATVSGDDVSRGKPAPDIFLQAADRLGVAPGRCLVLEDAPSGLQAAQAAGMSSVAITTSVARSELGLAARVVDSWDEIQPSNITSLFKPD